MQGIGMEKQPLYSEKPFLSSHSCHSMRSKAKKVNNRKKKKREEKK